MKLRVTKVYIGLALAAALYIGLLMANARAVKPWNDEAMAANAAYNLSYRGYTGVPFYDEAASGFPGVHRHTYYMLPLQFTVLAAWYRIANVSLFSTRMASLLWSLGGFLIFYHFLKNVTGDKAVAIVAVAVVATDYNIMTAASFGRYDTMVVTLGFGAYLAYVTLRERSLALALVVSHALVVASGATHPNGVFYCLGLCFLMWHYDRHNIRWKELAIVAVPYVVGGALMGLYIAQDFASFQGQMARNSGGRFGLLHPWDTFLNEIQRRYIPMYGLGQHSAGHESAMVRLKALPLVAYLGSVAACMCILTIRSAPRYRVVFILGGLHWFLLTFYENMKFSYYMVHLIPFYAVPVAVLVVWLWRNQSLPRWLVATGMTGLALLQIGGIVMKIRLNDYANSYAPAVEYVKTHAAPGDLVYASCGFGFAYGFDSNFRDDETLGFVSGDRAAFVVLEEIYDAQHNYMKTAQPDRYAHVQKILESYKPVYRNSEYRVYQRPLE